MAGEDSDGGDPGWLGPIRANPWVLVPGFGRLRSGRDQTASALAKARQTFVANVVSIPVIGLVGALMAERRTPPDGVLTSMPVMTGLTVVVGVACIVAVVNLGRTGFSPAPDADPVTVFQIDHARSSTLAQAPALLGFGAALFAASAVPAVVGAVLAIVGFGAMAPTAGRIAGIDQRLQEADGRSFLASLTRPASPSARGRRPES